MIQVPEYLTMRALTAKRLLFGLILACVVLAATADFEDYDDYEYQYEKQVSASLREMYHVSCVHFP